MFSNRKWVIITLADYTSDQLEDLVSNAIESSSSTLRKSVDGTKAILKWDGDTPTIFNGMVTYNHTQILTTLATSEWTSEEE